MGGISRHGDGVLFDITARPGAGAQRIRASKKDGIVVSVLNPPVKNRANREIVGLLSDVLGVPVTIHKSGKNCRKTIFASGLAPERLKQSLGITW